MFSDIFFTRFHDFLLSVTEKRASPRSLEGGGSEIPENADILGFFFPRKFFSSLGSYTILTKIYKNSSISAN